MRDRKRKSGDRAVRILAIACIVLAMVLAVVLVLTFRTKTAEKKEESAPAKTTAAEETQAAETLPASTAAGGGTHAEGETYTVVIPEKYTEPESTAGKTETSAGAETTSAAETTAAAAKKYTDLTGIPAGTEISADSLDLSDIGRYVTISGISEGDAVYARINGRSYRANDNVALSDLRYIVLPHYNFSGNIQVGELIVNKSIADDVKSAFVELFNAKYQIEKMHLVDDYWTGDGESTDTNSIEHNNTSSFNYRAATGSSHLSQHAYGRAIDLNPQQNPYVSYSSGAPKWSHANANDYIDRSSGKAHVITHADPAYKVFAARGFTWGGDWNTIKDYQHFERR